MIRLTRAISRLAWASAVALMMMLPSTSSSAKVSVSHKGPKVEKIEKTSTDDWYRHPHDDKYYTEAWTTVLETDDGHILTISFVYSNIGVLSGNTTVQIRHTLPGGRQAMAHRHIYGTSDYAENRATKRIVIGPNSMVLDGRALTLRLREDDFSADLVLTGWTDGVKLYDGEVALTDDKSEWMQTFFHIPRGDFRGSITFDDKTIAVSGAGYMDHSLQNALTTDTSTNWWTMRFFGKDRAGCFVSFRTPKERGGELVSRTMILHRGNPAILSDRLVVRPKTPRKDPKGHAYATALSLSLSEPGVATLTGELSGGERFDREGFMEELSWAERKIAEMVAGDPVAYRLRAQAKLSLTLPNGETVPLTGPALMESIVMGDDDKK